MAKNTKQLLVFIFRCSVITDVTVVALFMLTQQCS